MRLHVLSDLHIEFEEFEPPVTDADVVVLAADVHTGVKGVEWAARAFSGRPVLYVAGNHEFYRQAIPKHIHELHEAAKGTNVLVLENRTIRIDGILFAGCMLWTDFRLFGEPKIAGYHATQEMNDFRLIRVSPAYRRFRSIDAARVHAASARWLQRELTDQIGPSVVVTHHAPSRRSIPEPFSDDLVSAAYASDLEDLIGTLAPNLWIHGHLHTAQDYHVGSTRVLCNPRGYPGERGASGFKANLTVEVA